MRKVIVAEWMSLDGVVQAPGSPDVDRSGGFEHGGWHVPSQQEDGGDLHVIGLQLVEHEVTSTGAFLATYATAQD